MKNILLRHWHHWWKNRVDKVWPSPKRLPKHKQKQKVTDDTPICLKQRENDIEGKRCVNCSLIMNAES